MANVKKRIESIDLLRGVVMIIMALDHVRDYFSRDAFLFDPTDMTRTNALLFFTRWVTHFCAPVFVFLSGIAACLYGSRATKKELSFFLLTRGVWLILLELFVVTLGWTFNPAYPIHNLQVIWAIGFSMIALAGIIYLDRRIILLLGLALIAGHNLLDTIHASGHGTLSFLWSFLHEPGAYRYGNALYVLRYPVLPWIGVMTLMILGSRVNQSAALKGYGFNIGIVYLVWLAVILILYPLCQRYDQYKRAHLRQNWWLSYL